MKQTGKVAIGQIIMQGREHLVGIQPHGEGLVLHILRYGSEVRDAASYFEGLNVEPKQEAVTLAAELFNPAEGQVRA